jgi:hypothetical protein
MLVGSLSLRNSLRDRGCSARPVFPAPSDFWGPTKCKTSGASRREKADAHSVVVPGERSDACLPLPLAGEVDPRIARGGWGNSLLTGSVTRGGTPTPPSPASGRGGTNTGAGGDESCLSTVIARSVATRQSILLAAKKGLDCFASLAMTRRELTSALRPSPRPAPHPPASPRSPAQPAAPSSYPNATSRRRGA